MNIAHWNVHLASMVKTVRRLVNAKTVEHVIISLEDANVPQGGWALCARASVQRGNMVMNVHLNAAVKMVEHATQLQGNVTVPLDGLVMFVVIDVALVSGG